MATSPTPAAATAPSASNDGPASPATYTAYGLKIESALRLPQLSSAAGGADATVELSAVDRSGLEPTALGSRRVSGAEVALVYDSVGAFSIQGGEKIVVDPDPGVDPDLLRLYVTGVALAVLLHQRGRLVLHGSAVELDGDAALFLGGSGFGKSTTAGSLVARGHRLVADDVSAVELDGDRALVRGGVMQIKLWPDSAEWLDVDRARFRELPLTEKRARSVPVAAVEEPTPVRHVYVLEDGPRPESEPLSGPQACQDLVRHSYCGLLLEGDGSAGDHFGQCTALAEAVGVRRLRRPRSLAALDGLAELVEREMAECSSSKG